MKDSSENISDHVLTYDQIVGLPEPVQSAGLAVMVAKGGEPYIKNHVVRPITAMIFVVLLCVYYILRYSN